MKDISAETAYVNAAIAHGLATDQGYHRKANAAYRKLTRALAKLEEVPDRGRSPLTTLLGHDDPHVRCWAASHLLPLDEPRAITTLEELSTLSDIGIVRLSAEMVLQEWRAGRLKAP